MAEIPLGTDLRRVSSGTPKQYESALTTSLRRSLDQPSPWLAAAEQLGHFPTKRCVQMRPADWQELSGVMANITRLCHSSAPGRGQSCSRSSSPGFASCLELLLKLGQVTSCLLCVNGDDKSFSIARVAQAIRTTTCVLQAAIAEAVPAGLSAEVADSLARQRCEQTPLLSAVTWALRQEARALYFNPRPTALSLGTALLDFFHETEQLWPLGIFIPQQHELKLDATAAHMADPAAQLAMAMLRCAGRAMAEIGTGACRERLLCGLRVAYDMVQQISLLLDSPAVADTSAREALVKQLQQSPSLPQLMLALLAVESHRLHEQLGVSKTDSCILLVPQQQQQQQQRRTTDGLEKRLSKRQSESSWSGQRGPESLQQLGQMNGVVPSRRCSTAGSTGSAGLAEQQQSDQQHPPVGPLHQLRRTLSQQRLLQQQQQQEEEEHAEIEGAGELHQVWHQVLGMARKNLARDQQDHPEQQPEGPRAPLQQLWVSLGLPEGLLQLAADAGVSAAPPVQQYLAVCRVGKFLLQGSPLLQPQHGSLYDHAGSPLGAAVASSPPPTAAGAGAGVGAVGGSVIRHHSLSAAGAAPLPPPAPAAAAAGGQLSPFAYQAARTPSRSWSGKGAGALPPPWQSGSPAANSFLAASPSGIAAAGEPLIGASSIGSLSPRDYPGTAGALSVSAEAAEQLMESCRDYGLHGQEQLELLRLQRVVPVVLLNTAACLLQRQTNLTAAASPGNTSTTSSGTTSGSSSSRRVVSSEELQVVHAACTAAACVSRCWPVLQKVAAQQEELCDLLAECQPPSGVFAGLTTVCWKPYTLPEEVRLPVLPLLQLVVKLIWQLQPPWQQPPPQQQQQQQQLGTSGCLLSVLQQRLDSNRGHGQGVQVLSPVSGECLDSLLEVLTAVSKLPWEQHTATVAPTRAKAAAMGPADGAGSDSDDSEGSAAAVDAHLVAQAWQQECQPVAAAVEACLRTAGQVAAAADGALDFPPAGLASCRGLVASSAAAAAGGAGQGGPAGQVKVQRHPSAVALGSCLASLCAPFGRPGPLVAAAAAAAPGGPEQQQLFALLLSKLKVLLYNPASKKAGLLAMHPIEQTPIYIIRQLSTHSTLTVSSTQAISAGVGALPCSQQQLHTGQAAGSKAVLPWLLLLSRLMVLRGKLLGHLLAHEADEAGKAGATSALHTAYWHVKMAHESASTLAAQWKAAPAQPVTDGSGLKNAPQDQQQQVLVEADVQAELQLQLLPALKQAVQVLRAAMKLSRHYHETGFASGFAAGFAAGYAAAVAAASGLNGSSAAAAPGPVSFASPWAVLQQGCIRCLPQQLEAVGSKLAWQLRHLGCSNPLCVNLSLGSELWLVPAGSTEGRCSSSTGTSSAVTGSSNLSGVELSSGDDGAEGCQEVSHAGDAPALCLSCSRAHVQAPKH